jgi:hypothetical protein
MPQLLVLSATPIVAVWPKAASLRMWKWVQFLFATLVSATNPSFQAEKVQELAK